MNSRLIQSSAKKLLFKVRFTEKTPAVAADSKAHIAIFSRLSTGSISRSIVCALHRVYSGSRLA
jgi:hypothetical protein